VVHAAAPARCAARAAALAALGAQSALVAGSAFYQALVGRVLGYRPAHIAAHVRASGRELTPQVRPGAPARALRRQRGSPPAFRRDARPGRPAAGAGEPHAGLGRP